MPFPCAAVSASATRPRDVQRLRHGQPVRRQSARQRLALDELHRQEMNAGGLFDRIKGDDMRMVE